MVASKRILLCVGPTGSGKSRLIKKYVSEGKQPEVGHSLESKTAETKPFLCVIENEECIMYDTPGLGDTEKRDQVFLDELVQTLQRNCTGVHKFYFLLSVYEPRFNSYLQICLSLILQLAPDIKQKPSVLTVILTKADAANETAWNPTDAPIQTKIDQLKQIIKTKFSIDVAVILHGEGNQEQFKQDVKNASLDVFSQTQFMRNVETLDTQRTKAYEALAAAQKENADDKEKIGQLQAAYDKAVKDAEAQSGMLATEIKTLKDQIAAMKPEIHNHYYSDGNDGFCTLL